MGVVEDTLSLQPRETGSDQSDCGSLASKPTHFWKSGVAVMELDQTLSDVSDRKLIQSSALKGGFLQTWSLDSSESTHGPSD